MLAKRKIQNYIKFFTQNKELVIHKYGMWITLIILTGNVEMKIFSKMAGYKMNLPFSAGF